MNTLAQQDTSLLTPSASTKDTAALAGRILLAAIFILSGITKLGGIEGTAQYIASVGLPLAGVLVYAVIALEIIGGIMLVAGFRTRAAALALGAFSLAAAFLFHADFADQNQMIHFLKNLALAGGMLQVVAFGPGRFAVSRD